MKLLSARHSWYSHGRIDEPALNRQGVVRHWVVCHRCREGQRIPHGIDDNGNWGPMIKLPEKGCPLWPFNWFHRDERYSRWMMDDTYGLVLKCATFVSVNGEMCQEDPFPEHSQCTEHYWAELTRNP